MRIGTKKRPFYRVVSVDERNKRTGAYIENLGTYNPLTEPKEIKLNQDRIDYWIKQGAQMSVGFLRIIGKAPQRKPRKPKKEKPQVTEPATATAPAPETTEPATPATKEAEQPKEPTAETPEQPKETPAEAPVQSEKPEDQNTSEPEKKDETA